jgi:general stress protein YciG
MRAETLRGFAAMEPEKHREIARLGGLAAQATGRAHQFSSEEGRLAGKKGGNAVSADREHMSKIGTRGGQRRAKLREVPE